MSYNAIPDDIRARMLKEDFQFLSKNLSRYRNRLEVIDRYVEAFRRGMDAEKSEIKKSNAGRREANLWLQNL